MLGVDIYIYIDVYSEKEASKVGSQQLSLLVLLLLRSIFHFVTGMISETAVYVGNCVNIVTVVFGYDRNQQLLHLIQFGD